MNSKEIVQQRIEKAQHELALAKAELAEANSKPHPFPVGTWIHYRNSDGGECFGQVTEADPEFIKGNVHYTGQNGKRDQWFPGDFDYPKKFWKFIHPIPAPPSDEWISSNAPGHKLGDCVKNPDGSVPWVPVRGAVSYKAIEYGPFEDAMGLDKSPQFQQYRWTLIPPETEVKQTRKFKVGDWILFPGNFPGRITRLGADSYIGLHTDGSSLLRCSFGASENEAPLLPPPPAADRFGPGRPGYGFKLTGVCEKDDDTRDRYAIGVREEGVFGLERPQRGWYASPGPYDGYRWTVVKTKSEPHYRPFRWSELPAQLQRHVKYKGKEGILVLCGIGSCLGFTTTSSGFKTLERGWIEPEQALKDFIFSDTGEPFGVKE